MLAVENLAISVGGKRILSDVSLAIGYGEAMALFGPNGSGKTTLLKAIMGFPAYRVDSGRIIFKGEDITSLPLDERSRRGIGMAFQAPPVVRGVRLGDLLRITMGKRGMVREDRIRESAARLKLADFLPREVNLGFSGGEVKRSELLQLVAQDPEFALLDEPDSGVDLENIQLVGEVVNELIGKEKAGAGGNRKRSALIITHAGHILDYVDADKACILFEGSIRCVGNPRRILADIQSKGYEGCARCLSVM
jgi:Fe-S cluster assembly ATP-binding protein